eukprot:m.55567 g.55567  ORF g.55567 m.55567 type:complete len:312 (+) comp9254_c0_seq2:111-1046(+)
MATPRDGGNYTDAQTASAASVPDEDECRHFREAECEVISAMYESDEILVQRGQKEGVCGITAQLHGLAALDLLWPPGYPLQDSAIVDFTAPTQWPLEMATEVSSILSVRSSELLGSESGFELLQLADEEIKKRAGRHGTPPDPKIPMTTDRVTVHKSACQPTEGSPPAPLSWSVIHIDHMNAPALYKANLEGLAAETAVTFQLFARQDVTKNRLQQVVLVVIGTQAGCRRMLAGLRTRPMDKDKQGKKCRERKSTVLAEGMCTQDSHPSPEQDVFPAIQKYETYEMLIKLCVGTTILSETDWTNILAPLRK